jgi:hypothetical protein
MNKLIPHHHCGERAPMGMRDAAAAVLSFRQ